MTHFYSLKFIENTLLLLLLSFSISETSRKITTAVYSTPERQLLLLLHTLQIKLFMGHTYF